MKRSRRILSGLAICLALGAAAGSVLLARHWRRAASYDANIDRAIALLDLPKDAGFDSTLDRIRLFINDHSRHLMDEEFWRLHAENDGNVYLMRILAHAEGKSSKRAHMDCSTRSNVIRNILLRMGYQVRVVSIFDTDRTDRNASHTFVEVRNPATGEWQTLDADFDLYWKSRATGKRVALSEAAGDLGKIVPCGEQRCGWDVEGRDGQKAFKLAQQLDIISVTRKEVNIRYALYTPRAKIAAIFQHDGEGGTFCQVEAKRCRDGFVAIADAPALSARLEP